MEKQKEMERRLLACGIENAGLEARLLCEAFDGAELEQALQRRCSHYPLQYILGTWGFWREEYEVNEHCLIPRPDTELLVENAVKMLPDGARFLDLCTGSGCVAISVLASRPDSSAVAVDLFEETLALAERNARRNGVADRLQLCLADVLKKPCLQGPFDAILSNPPYITGAAMKELQEEVTHEPSAALYGGEDGLCFYRAILESWQSLLTRDGFLLLEIGYDQAQALCELAAQYQRTATVYRDLGGNDRVVLLK